MKETKSREEKKEDRENWERMQRKGWKQKWGRSERRNGKKLEEGGMKEKNKQNKTVWDQKAEIPGSSSMRFILQNTVLHLWRKQRDWKRVHFVLHWTLSFMPMFLVTATSALSTHCFMTVSLKSLLLANSQKHPWQLSPWPSSDQTRIAQHLLLLLIPDTFFLGSAHWAEGPTVSAELPS